MAITRTALDHDGFRGGIDVRVSLRDDAGSGDSAFDGAWWPRTRDLAAEVPSCSRSWNGAACASSGSPTPSTPGSPRRASSS